MFWTSEESELPWWALIVRQFLFGAALMAAFCMGMLAYVAIRVALS
jgi:hypothetical protein